MIEFLCLQCCDCGTFQCQQKRKDSKFSCKVCGKKQSVIKVYGISYKAKDIRGLVMKYNEMRGRDELVEQEQVLASNETTEDYSQEGNTSSLNDGAPARPETSKWAQFMEDDKR